MIPAKTNIFVCTEIVDMRKSFDGLAAVTRQTLGKDPESGSLFVFVNRCGNRLKCLWWDRTGFCLLYKRLEWGIFRLPSPFSPNLKSVQIDPVELMKILEGIGLPPKRHCLYKQSLQK